MKGSLEDLSQRVERLEHAVFGGKNGSSGKKKTSSTSAPSVDATSNVLPSHIVRLRDEGFLKNPKSASEIHEALQSIYACALNRVAVALLRLQRKRALRKTTKTIDGKQKVAYVW